jgi:serine/threonine protein kinase/DNA-binding LacI/PurR family transcriptional regulator
MADALIGREIGQYEIQSLIGQGGMAIVYRAYQPSMKRDVALKVVSSLIAQDSTFLARFNREAEFIASLEHAHIVPVYDHGTTDDGLTYLAMRYLKGGSLAEHARQGTLMELDQINSILQQIAGALDYAHQRGIIHRDIKPSNVLLDEQGAAYLADFGLARMIEPRPGKTLTQDGSLLGTPAYISPEQVREATLDERSDLYSLGVVLYEMLAGRPPFVGDSAFNVLRAQIDQEPPPIRKYRPGLSPAAEAVLVKALQKEPNRRFQRASAMADAFNRAVQADLSTRELARPARPMSATLPHIILGRPRVRLFAAGLVLVFLVMILGVFSLRTAVAPNVSVTDTLPPTLRELSRPATGTPDDLKLTDSEIALARASLKNSFIGMVACTLTTDYHASLARSVRTRAQALGLPIKVEDSQKETFRQPAIINSFIAQGAKAIIICELDAQSIADAVRAAQDAGVKVVRFSETVSDRGSVTITFRNEDMGRAAGSFAADLINKEMGGQANVAILDYPIPTTMARADAMQKALLEKAPNAKIVGRWQGGVPEDGERSMTAALAEHPEINVILSINDAGAYGAVQALRKAGKKPGDVAIISVDAETEARRMIDAGEFFRASVDSGAVLTGELGVDAAVKLLAESMVPKQIFLPGMVVTRTSPTATPATQQ